ncbi:MAG TPA: hypothetical protein PLV58_12570, partial [Campylobacterales bacterium]|nr:hypothetical protein [Campylobacterales bacterium]
YTGTYPDCKAPSCPTGYTGTYPNCVAPTCPAGYTGVYPACVAPACPTGYTGTYPDCVAPTCPSGYTGTYPNCVAPTCPAGYSGSYPDCVAPPPPVSVCPSGYSGVYPNCVLISSFTSLFSSLNTASLGSTASVVLPDSTNVSMGMRQYTFDKVQSEPIYKRAWVSSDFQYIATDMSGDLYSMIYAADNSAIYDETSVNTFYANCISGCSAVGVGSIKSIFVKTDVANPVSSSNIVEARNFASSSYVGTAGDFSFFAPIAKTYTDLVTSVKNLSSLYGAFQDTAIKYETISIYPVRNWNSLTNAGGHAEPDLNNAVFEEKYYHDNDGEWYTTGRFAANYSDLTALTPSQLTVLNAISSQ